jgi:hypothetical protein
MKIEYRTAGAGAYLVLADESADDRVTGYQPRLSKNPQIDDLYESDVPFIKDRGNAKWQVQFGIERKHASAAEAFDFLKTHLNLFVARGNWDLRVTQDASVRTFTQCALVELTPRENPDLNTFCRYSFAVTNFT